jgi:hydroxylaminobenzene mutase
MAGLLWGFVVPHTPCPRLALGAHIQFVTNGLLIIVMGVTLLKLPHSVGPKSAGVMLLTPKTTTFTNTPQ